MKLSYKKLCKLLIDRDIKHKDFIDKTGISRSTFYKLKKDENVTTDVILKICEELNCDISEIMECID
ncbi:helix-turn-helix domain-containing protein [Pseudostreptobacillus hongkongensis]|uniref:helix-turn-helix domain-containing protein n=1 Tax=Pseudostreptobacillus hongkongensis TaxID=1162717 RepID=UPI000831B2BC|nr:helix-turn-helix transcriptional regulator [Pseudostreptobacillus hongkongensis]